MGITGRLFVDPVKTNRVGLIVEVPDMETFQKAMQSDEAANAIRFDGVRPDTFVVLTEASGSM
jgi:ATP-dependent exoDNAse (exonuclease V) alpha subunit